ncbi:hypothetical protein [Saccharopolyspora sp. ASAGF58]
MGGFVAMAVLGAAPQRVAGLLLVDTRAVVGNGERGPAAFRAGRRW